MRYQILGPLRIVREDAVHATGSAKVDALLGALLLRAGHIVPTSRLLTELWEDDPPRHCVTSLHVHISKLRKFLGNATGTREILITRAPGYLLQIEPNHLDANVFLSLMKQARTELRRGFLAESRDLLESALALWRGPMLGGLPHGPIVSGSAISLEESRLQCAEMLAAIAVQLGRQDEAVGLLHAMLAENPVHEEFHRLLMLALYRSGRRAEALRAYQRARTALVEGLGMEPGRPLRTLHQAVLQEERVPALLKVG